MQCHILLAVLAHPVLELTALVVLYHFAGFVVYAFVHFEGFAVGCDDEVDLRLEVLKGIDEALHFLDFVLLHEALLPLIPEKEV